MRIKEWGDRPLGQNAIAGEQLVLLVRGELLRRYPNAVIYAVAAVSSGGPARPVDADPKDECHPLFRGTLKPDVTFLGFDLKRDDAVADPGWFFVIQQQPTEPRFGLDAADFSEPLPALNTWNNLSWGHFADMPAELQALSYLPVVTTLPCPVNGRGRRVSNRRAPGVITLQRPVRIAIHAREIDPALERAARHMPTDTPIPVIPAIAKLDLQSALVARQAPAGGAVPVRVETRFFPQTDGSVELRVRVYPDAIPVNSHEPELTAEEVDWGQHFWEQAGARRTTTRVRERPGSSSLIASTRRARRGSRALSNRRILRIVRPHRSPPTSRSRRRPCSPRTGRRRSRGRALR